MAQIITGIAEAKVISSLDTYNHTTLLAAVYQVKVDVTEIPTSGISVVIKQNFSTIVTSLVPAATQNTITIATPINCAISDVISVVITSTSAVEAGPNEFKGLINIHVGPY